MHDQFGRREAIAGQPVGRLHDQGVGLFPLCRLGGTAGTQLEITRVKQRPPVGLEKELRGTKDMAGRQKRYGKSANQGRYAERKHMFVTLARQARLHEARGPFRDDNLIVRRDMVAVRMRDEGERLRLPWIKPDVFVRQINAPLVLHRKHGAKLTASGEARERAQRELFLLLLPLLLLVLDRDNDHEQEKETRTGPVTQPKARPGFQSPSLHGDRRLTPARSSRLMLAS